MLTLSCFDDDVLFFDPSCCIAVFYLTHLTASYRILIVYLINHPFISSFTDLSYTLEPFLFTLSLFRASLLKSIRKELGSGYESLEYATVGTGEYLIEIKKTHEKSLANITKTWLLMSTTQKVSRYHPPDVAAAIALRDRTRDLLAAEADKAWSDFLDRAADHVQQFRGLALAVAKLDCLLALARTAQLPGYTRPRIRYGQGIKVC